MPDAALTSLIAGFVAVVTGTIAARANRAVSVIEAETTPYAELAKRVRELEHQVSELLDRTHELQAASNEDRLYIRRLLAAWSERLPDVLPPQPLPQWYMPHPSQQPEERP